MSLVLKQYEIDGITRDAYVYAPSREWDSLTKPSSIMVLRSSEDESSVLEILSAGLKELSEEYHILLTFPNPGKDGWNEDLSAAKEKDIAFLKAINSSITSGIINGTCGVMNDVHYIIGIGEASAIAVTFTAMLPETTAAVALVAAEALPAAASDIPGTAVLAILFNCSDRVNSYFIGLNKADKLILQSSSVEQYANAVAQLHTVTLVKDIGVQHLSNAVIKKTWYDLFYNRRRINTCPEGNITYRLHPEDYHFEKHLNDCCLGDNNGMPHTWLEHVPQCVLDNPTKPVPLVIFSHGGSDNPMKAADMSKWHEIGEKEGFITVYPLSCNGVNFNLSLNETQPSDVDYYLALINYIKAKYPIDASRVYISGFSNGAGMAQVMGMLHPELFAAIAPIDSMWPYVMPGPFLGEFNLEKNLMPITQGLELQKKHCYRMPVWYVYGTREVEYPVYMGTGQQYQYDAWKQYNNIPVQPTPEKPLDTECSIGVTGDSVEVIYPCPEYPEYKYSIHRFYSAGDKKNYYNYALAHGKGHDVHYVDALLAWKYISRFSRNPDGTLNEDL